MAHLPTPSSHNCLCLGFHSTNHCTDFSTALCTSQHLCTACPPQCGMTLPQLLQPCLFPTVSCSNITYSMCSALSTLLKLQSLSTFLLHFPTWFTTHSLLLNCSTTSKLWSEVKVYLFQHNLQHLTIYIAATTEVWKSCSTHPPLHQDSKKMVRESVFFLLGHRKGIVYSNIP